LNLSLGAVMLIAASMCKGVQGLFPLTVIFFYWAVFRNIQFSRMLKNSAFILMIIIVFYGIILLNESARTSYEMYFNNRIVGTFAHPASTHTDRFYIIEQLFSELLPVLILMLLSRIIIKIKRKDFVLDKVNIQFSLWFILIALSGTLPLIATIEQSGFYIVTAFPYYAIGFAILFAPFLTAHIEQINTGSGKFKTWTRVAGFFLTLSVIFSVITIIYIPKRDKEILHDIYCIGPIITNGSIIGIANEMNDDWSLFTYCSRYYYISLDASSIRHKYFILDKTLDHKLIPEGYRMVNLSTQKYDLYIRNK
jgi:hypothetical protein